RPGSVRAVGDPEPEREVGALDRAAHRLALERDRDLGGHPHRQALERPALVGRERRGAPADGRPPHPGPPPPPPPPDTRPRRPPPPPPASGAAARRAASGTSGGGGAAASATERLPPAIRRYTSGSAASFPACQPGRQATRVRSLANVPVRRALATARARSSPG